MSIELIGTSSAGRMVLQELPALISPETVGETRSDGVDPGYLCLISQVDGQLTVWDLGGKSGTFVNGSRVTRAALKESDTIGFGVTEFRVHSEQPPKRYLYGVRN
ncbi:MAG: FHA domain-containing protein [Thermoguttaceae bacterium]